MRGRLLALVAILLPPLSGAASAQSLDVTVAQIPGGAGYLIGRQQPELSPGTDVSEVASRKIGRPINCTGASKATKPQCFTATLHGRQKW